MSGALSSTLLEVFEKPCFTFLESREGFNNAQSEVSSFNQRPNEEVPALKLDNSRLMKRPLKTLYKISSG